MVEEIVRVRRDKGRKERLGLNGDGRAKGNREDKERLGSPAVCCRCSVCKTVFLNGRIDETRGSLIRMLAR